MKIPLLIFALTIIHHSSLGQIQQGRAEKFVSFEEKQSQAAKGEQSTGNPIQEINLRIAAKKGLNGVISVKYFTSAGDDFTDFFNDLFDSDTTRRSDYNERSPHMGSASGVIISPDGYIVTNHHVVNGSDSILVTLPDHRSYKAEIIGSDADTDIALLKIDEKNLKFIEFGHSDSSEVGDPVLTIGNPLDLPQTVTAGIVSAKARNLNILPSRSAIESYLQTDAPVTFGNSGGALVNARGKLIGITAAIATSTGEYGNYSFAIPVEIVSKACNDLLQYGKVARGYFGMTVRDPTPHKVTKLPIYPPKGVIVDSLQSNAAAIRAGLQTRDVITHVNNRPTESIAQLLGLTARFHPGDSVTISILRKGQERIINVKLMSDHEARNAGNTGKEILKSLGIEIGNLSEQEKKSLQLNGGVKVLSVTKGEISTRTSMRKDFIIIRIDNKTVNNTDDFINELLNKKGYVIADGFYPGTEGFYFYEFRIEALTFL